MIKIGIILVLVGLVTPNLGLIWAGALAMYIGDTLGQSYTSSRGSKRHNR